MNTGQMLLTTGAMVLLGLTVMTVNQTFSQHGYLLEQTEIGIYATSLATSVLEEAIGKAFDEATVDEVAKSVNDLTPVTSLGLEPGETIETADDFDDYNGLTRVIDVPGTDRFTIRTFVHYITPTNPNGISTSRTYHKKITVYVTGTATADTVVMHHMFSYWSFR